MNRLITILALLLLSPAAVADNVIDEIKNNLDEAQKKVENAQGQIADLEDNNKKLAQNISEIERALAKKGDERKEARDVLTDYHQKLNGASAARKDFDHTLIKDRQELALVEKDIIATEKRLAALQAARKALEESIEISEDNLSKMNDRSESWNKNLAHLQEEITDIEKDIEKLSNERDSAAKKKLENQQALNKWKKSLASFNNTFQRLDQRYRAALREEKRKADKR